MMSQRCFYPHVLKFFLSLIFSLVAFLLPCHPALRSVLFILSSAVDYLYCIFLYKLLFSLVLTSSFLHFLSLCSSHWVHPFFSQVQGISLHYYFVLFITLIAYLFYLFLWFLSHYFIWVISLCLIILSICVCLYLLHRSDMYPGLESSCLMTSDAQ